MGHECWEKTGEALPQETFDIIKECKIALLGAVLSPMNKEYPSVVLRLRKMFDLYCNIRPAKTFLTNDNNIDIILYRENIEGLYSGEEHVFPDKVIANRIITKKNTQRFCKKVFSLINNSNRSNVVLAHKANVLRESCGLFKKIYYETAKKYPKIKANDLLVDACAMKIVLQPLEFDAIVAPNLFGDILSDVCAGVVGGLGLLPSANMGDTYALFEPVHGSAPDIAGKGIANPTAMFLSLSMLLKHINYENEANIIENAIESLYVQKKMLTPDFGGPATTKQFTKALLENLKN